MQFRTEEQILSKVFKDLSLNKRHKYYDETVEKSKYWRSIVSGEGQESIILKKRQNDTRLQKEETVRLFNTHTPYLSNRLKSVFKQVDRTKRVNKVLEPKKDSDIKEDTWRAFTSQINNFYQTESLDEYLNRRALDYSATDSNAYLLIDFFPFNNESSFPLCYPMVFSAKDTILKQKDVKGLQYIVFRKPLKMKQKKEIITPHVTHFGSERGSIYEENYEYFLYTRNNSYNILVKKVADKSFKDTEGHLSQIVRIANDNKTEELEFLIQKGEHNSNRVPAISLGYYQDAQYNYEINESHYRPAKEVFNEHCEKKSRHDNQMALFGFIRAYFYGQTCNYRDDNGSCNDGYQDNNIVCPSCKGSGTRDKSARIARNEFEITEIEIPLPTGDPTNDEILDLSKLVHMVEIPESVFEMYQKQLDDLSRIVSISLFSTNVFDKSEINVQTATGVNEHAKAKSNVIYEYAEHKARVWKFVVDQIAHYFNLSQHINRNMEFDSDFKLETEVETVALINASKTANVSMEYIRTLENDLMSKRYSDNPDELRWFSEKTKWKPFYNKSENEVLTGLGLLPADDPKKVFWLFFEDIFLEIRHSKQLQGIENKKYKEPFYNLTHSEQKDVIDYFIEQYKSRLPSDELIIQPLEE